MSVRLALAAALAAGLALAVVGPAGASSGDWVTFQAANGRSGFNAAETAITPSTASQLQLDWTARSQNVSPNWVTSQAAVSGGLVYWGSWDGYERATNASGGLVWQTYLGRQAATCDSYWSVGVAGTAAVVNSVVYVGEGDGRLYALDAATGSVLWETSLGGPNSFVYSSPAVFGGSVYIGVASSPPDCPLVQGQLVQVNATNGAIQHTMKVVPDGCTGGTVWGSPAVDESSGTVYFATGNPGPCSKATPDSQALIEVRASDLGVVGKWQIPNAQAIADGDFGSTPTLFTRTTRKTTQAMVGIANKNGVYYAFQRDHLIAGPRWQLQIATGGSCGECGQGSIAPSAWDGHTIYAAGGQITINGTSCAGSVIAIDPNTGGIMWQRCLPDGPVLGAVAAAPGIVAVGEGNQILILSATSGQTLFAHSTQGSIWAGPAIADGVLYAGDKSGTLYAFGVAEPATSVLIPSDGATLSGSSTTLDASASDATRVEFLLFGGGYWGRVLGTATPTYYGWLMNWNTQTVANGSYVLVSEAFNSTGSAFSPKVHITIAN